MPRCCSPLLVVRVPADHMHPCRPVGESQPAAATVVVVRHAEEAEEEEEEEEAKSGQGWSRIPGRLARVIALQGPSASVCFHQPSRNKRQHSLPAVSHFLTSHRHATRLYLVTRLRKQCARPLRSCRSLFPPSKPHKTDRNTGQRLRCKTGCSTTIAHKRQRWQVERRCAGTDSALSKCLALS